MVLDFCEEKLVKFNEDDRRAICLPCTKKKRQDVAFSIGSGNGRSPNYTTLKRHLRDDHGDLIAKIVVEDHNQPKIASYAVPMKQKPIPKVTKESNRYELVRLFSRESLPLRLVESRNFRRYQLFLYPNLDPLSRKTLGRYLNKVFKQEQGRLKSLLEGLDCKVLAALITLRSP